jgi:hypothetical protein
MTGQASGVDVARKREPVERITSTDLLKAVRRLPEKTPIVTALFPDADGKRAWVYWLSNYVQVSDDPRRADRDARFIYNHWWNAPIFIWLAEAIGVDQRRVRKAAEIASSQGNSPAQAAAIRRILPWSLIARQLTRSGPRAGPDITPVTSGHFVAYHNSDEQGPYYPDSADRRIRKGEEHSFVTAKPFRAETLKGQRLWGFEGSGSPKRYRLVSAGTITRITRWKRPSQYRKPGREHGIRVHFKMDVSRDAVDVTDLAWFQELLRQQQSFRNGFNRLSDPSIIRSLLQLPLKHPHASNSHFDGESAASTLADLEHIKRTVKDQTTRKALIDARLGQGQFRAGVGKRWNDICAATGCGISAVLRASHVKPWSRCNNSERLNPANGFLLAAHIDALFDRGLITFANDGTMLISKRISPQECKRFRLPMRLRRKPTNAERRFLAYHRREVYR